MATKRTHVKAVIQFRRATEDEWIQVDPILRDGEPALSTDINKFKIGDGTSHWSELSYQVGEGGGGEPDEYTAGKGIKIQYNVISLDDFIIDCGTSTTGI